MLMHVWLLVLSCCDSSEEEPPWPLQLFVPGPEALLAAKGEAVLLSMPLQQTTVLPDDEDQEQGSERERLGTMPRCVDAPHV